MNNVKNIVLFGGGLHASYCIDTILKEKKYRIVGIVDSIHDLGSIVNGYPIIGRQEKIREITSKYNIHGGFISIGDNWSRKKVFDCVIDQVPDFRFINAIHPSTIIGMNVRLGVGILTMAGSIINPNSIVGNFCFIATGAQLEHNCNLGDFASISAGSMTGGKVNIGKYSAITLGVIVMDRINIGENTVVGSGSLVTKDLPDNVLAYGMPAKIIRSRIPGEKFLKSE